MQYTLVTLAVFAALGTATPFKPPTKKTFTVSQVPGGNALKNAPAIGMLKTYNKYKILGAQVPTNVKNAAAAAQSGTVAAIPEAVSAIVDLFCASAPFADVCGSMTRPTSLQ